MNKYDYFYKMPMREDEATRKQVLCFITGIILFLLLLGIATTIDLKTL